MGYDVQDLMQLIVAERGAAVHLYGGAAPILEIARQLHCVEGPRLDDDEPHRMFVDVAPSEERREFERSGLTSFDYEFRGSEHFHVMAFRDSGRTRLELRRFADDDEPDAA